MLPALIISICPLCDINFFSYISLRIIVVFTQVPNPFILHLITKSSIYLINNSIDFKNNLF